MNKTSVVIQFAKWPESGKVKTRLAKSIGFDAAKAVHIELMTQVLQQINADSEWKALLCLDKNQADWPEELDVLQRQINEHHVEITLQQGGGLGDRMAHAIEEGLNCYSEVVIVGSDCPTVNGQMIAQAIASLRQGSDIVLVPAEDGGYVMIAARVFERCIFDGVDWGQSTVCQTTVENSLKAGFHVDLLPETWDVDDLNDYERWQSQNSN